MKPKKFEYEQTCSRCDGSGTDPDMPDCVCDCCENGLEILNLTEAEAVEYPNARKRERSGDLEQQ